jgi:SAM-dependent methyltransferase
MDHPQPAVSFPAGELCQAVSPIRVGLHGENLGATAYQLDGYSPRAGAYVDHQLVRTDFRFGYEALSCPGEEKVLPEAAASLVPGAPPCGGHGALPSLRPSSLPTGLSQNLQANIGVAGSAIMGPMSEDSWAPLADRFVDGHYGSLRGRVRTHVIDRHLRWHLPGPPAAVVDVGGGAGTQSLPLARDGYRVTIVDPSPAMLSRAEAALAAEPVAVRGRVSLVEATGQEAPGALGGRRFAGVLCHGVLMYLDDPAPIVVAMAELADDGGVVSIVAKNQSCLAVRPALAGRWAEALSAFDADRQINGLEVETRADTVEGLSALLADNGVERVAWYGVRLFTDGWTPDRPATDDEEGVLAVELEASRRDPYRQLSRLFHLVGARRRIEG